MVYDWGMVDSPDVRVVLDELTAVRQRFDRLAGDAYSLGQSLGNLERRVWGDPHEQAVLAELLHEIRRRFGSPGRMLDEREMRELSAFLFEYLAGVPRKDWDLASRRAKAQEQAQTWLVTSGVVEELHRRAREQRAGALRTVGALPDEDRKSTRLNSSHGYISYAVFCLKKKILSITRTVGCRVVRFREPNAGTSSSMSPAPPPAPRNCSLLLPPHAICRCLTTLSPCRCR